MNRGVLRRSSWETRYVSTENESASGDPPAAAQRVLEPDATPGTTAPHRSTKTAGSERVQTPSIWVWAVAAIALIALIDTVLDSDFALLVAAQIMALAVFAIADRLGSPRWPAAITALITSSALVLILGSQLHGTFRMPSLASTASLRPNATSSGEKARSLNQQDARTADLHRIRLIGKRLDGLDLRGRNFDGVDASGASFRGSLLQGASLRGTILRGSCLRGAHLRGADLTGADLSGADVTGADLPPGAPRPASKGACR